ncbi:MAG: T9SS type A sorting domain-containing protein [Bacteroidales bacterium]|nr:T9SS type A sorting domain-containing protein [Bacteroidales bacterium]
MNTIAKSILAVLVVTLSVTAKAQNFNATYTYDANGNRITATVVYLSKSPTVPSPKVDDQLPIDPQTTLKINIFPNPTEGLLQVELSGVTDEQISAPSNAIRIFDTQGRLLFAISPISTSNTVDLSNYNDGTYIMQLFFAGKMRSFKIVKG